MHGNAVDAAEIRAELDARMASTGQSRGDSERTAAIRDLIDRIGEILNGEPDAPAGDGRTASLHADLVPQAGDALPGGSDFDISGATVAHTWLDSAPGEPDGFAGHEGAIHIDDSGYGPDAFPAGSIHCDGFIEDGADDPPAWAGDDESFAGDSENDMPLRPDTTERLGGIAAPDYPRFGDNSAADVADGSSDRIASADPFAGAMLANRPLGYWRLGESDRSNGPARDETGTAAGTWHVMPTQGADDPCSRDIETVSIPDHPAWQLVEGTIQFWIRPDDIHTRQGLIARCGGDAGVPGQLTVMLESNDIAVQLHGPNGGAMTARGVIEDHAWHQVSVSFGTDGLEIWIDGTLVARDPSIRAGIAGTDGGWVVGAGTDPAHPGVTVQDADVFTGSIAELAIFHSQLGLAAIRGLYDAGVDGTDVMNPAAAEPAEGTAMIDLAEPAAIEDVISDVVDSDDSGEAVADWAAEPVPADPPAAGNGAVAATGIQGEGGGEDFDMQVPRTGTSRTLASGWIVALASGAVEGDDGASLILSGDAAGTITLPDGSEIAFDGMTRIDYGPRGA